MLKLRAITILFCGITTLSYGQDSTKKTPVTKPATTVAVPNKFHAVKPVTAPATKPAAPVATTVKHDVTPAAAPVNLDKSLNGQYQYLLTKLYHYQQPFVAEFWRNAIDTLNSNKSKLKGAQAKLTEQGKLVDSLKADVTSKDQTLNESNAKVNSVSLLGIPVSKSTYNIIMWGLVIVFGAAAGIVIARSGGYSREAKYRTQLYNELDEEFKTYKAKANDKEKKLARELQTERNKVDELMGRG
jgi:hypothetical protein